MAQPNHFPTLPNDLLWTIFSNVPNANPANLMGVCQLWNTLFKNEKDSANIRFWKPIYREMRPKNIQASTDMEVSPNFQAVVKTFFTTNRENIDFVVSLIENDQQLAKCLHSSDWKLEEFKAKPALERSRIIWRALHHDATPILVRVIHRYIPSYVDQALAAIDSAPPRDFSEESKREFEEHQNRAFGQFMNTQKFSPTISSLIQQHKVPYNKAEFICALLSCICGAHFVPHILFQIVKSHKDLSELNGKTFNRPGPNGDPSVPAARSVIQLCMDTENSGISLNDLILCKLLDENGKYLN